MATLYWPGCVEARRSISKSGCPLPLGTVKRQYECTWVTPSLHLSAFKGMPFKFSVASHRKLEVRSFRVSALSTSSNYLVKKVSAGELQKLLEAERTYPVVVDFYATWCGPCILLAQQLEMLAVEYGKSVLFVKVDTDEEYELAKQLEIRGLPTIVFVSADPKKYAIRTEGLLPNDTIRTLIDTEL